MAWIIRPWWRDFDSLQNARMVRPNQRLHTRRHAANATPPPGDWQTDAPVRLLRNVMRLTAPNPGFMTGPGTNSYLVGDASTGFIAIDPGPADADHIQRLWRPPPTRTAAAATSG